MPKTLTQKMLEPHLLKGEAVAGLGYTILWPKVVKVRLEGELSHGVSAKDIILELLRRRSVKGGVGRIFEFCAHPPGQPDQLWHSAAHF